MFLDGILTFSRKQDKPVPRPLSGGNTLTLKVSEKEVEHLCLVIEVKIFRQQIGEILRQLKTYASTFHANQHCDRVSSVAFVLAANFALSETELKTLQDEGFYYIYLGEGFEKWFTEHAQVAATPHLEL